MPNNASDAPVPGDQRNAEGDVNKEDSKNEDHSPPWYKRKGILITIGIVLIVGLVVGVLWWLHARKYESTDDAFVDGHVSDVSARVPGRVDRVLVDDNEQVKAGQVLVEIDPRDLETALAQQQAALEVAKSRMDQAESALPAAKAEVTAAQGAVSATEAEVNRATAELARNEALPSGIVSAQLITNLRASLESAKSNLKSARARAIAAEAAVPQSEAAVSVAQAQITQAQANRAQAKLELSYAKIISPIDGHVARRQVEVGNYVQVGQTLLSVVSNDLWITANFKETQLDLMKPGQPVRIRIDAFPHLKLQGKVDSIQRGTGARFSLLPTENATGNYVKVVQRVPVKIIFNDHAKSKIDFVGVGMSVSPRVQVRD